MVKKSKLSEKDQFANGHLLNADSLNVKFSEFNMDWFLSHFKLRIWHLVPLTHTLFGLHSKFFRSELEIVSELFISWFKWPSVELVVKFHRSNLTHTILTEFDLFVSTLIHPDATVIPEVSSILRDDFVHSDSYEQPICDLAKPKFFELEVIDDLSVSLLKVSLVFVSCFLLLFSIC